MKKIKLFALAVMAMLSTNAFAQDLASDGFKFEAVPGGETGQVQIKNLANDYVFASDGVVTIPATLTNSSGDDYQVIGIADGAFNELTGEPRLKVKGLKIAASVTYIGTDAFKGMGNLASVEFGTASTPSELSYIKDGAFANNPMLKAISFANCPKMLYFTVDGKVKDAQAYAHPFWDCVVDGGKATNPNTALATITLNEGTLDFGEALAHLTNLATQNIKNTRITLLAGKALDGNAKIETLELPETKVYKTSDGTLDYTKAPKLQANALAGSQIKTLIVNGKILAAYENLVEELGIPATTADTPVPTLTTVTFKGDIGVGGIKASAFAGNTKLANVTFEGALAEGAVVNGAFTNAGKEVQTAAGSAIKLTVSALKAVDGAFAVKAFAEDAVVEEASRRVLVKVGLTFNTDAAANAVNDVKWDKMAPAATQVLLDSNDGGKTYYAKYHATQKMSFSKGKGDVVIYEAYADGSDIYMDPLYSINDKYVVAPTVADGDGAKAVIIKVKGTSSLIVEKDGKKYIECEGAAGDALITQRYLAGDGVLANQLQFRVHNTNQEINAIGAEEGYANYAVAKISTNGLKFKPISNDGTFYINDCAFIKAKKSASGVRVIWLDEEGNTTAIQKVQIVAADNDAIYNLRGEKVNAAYKGLVIKNGKKYIQK